jgi:hypothetical protein|tara:strand:+ start:337 stop:501 length:165 start_codon:yes stop_codon:yes gene_type:complete
MYANPNKANAIGKKIIIESIFSYLIFNGGKNSQIGLNKKPMIYSYFFMIYRELF